MNYQVQLEQFVVAAKSTMIRKPKKIGSNVDKKVGAPKMASLIFVMFWRNSKNSY